MILPTILTIVGILMITLALTLLESKGKPTFGNVIKKIIGVGGMCLFGIGADLRINYFSQESAMKVIRDNYSLEINKTIVDDKVISSDTTVIFK